MVQNPFANGALSVTIDADSSGLQSSISSAKSKLGDFRKAAAGAGLAVGALSAGAMAKAVGSAADFEQAMTGVEKVTNPETAAEMGDAIKDMSATMPIAQEELAGIAEQAGRLGVEGVDNLTDYTQTVGRMATATDLTAEEAGDAFARIGTLMDIPVEQSENMGSAMNMLANNMGSSAAEITDVMTRAGGAFNQLGVGKEQALALSGAMNEVSASSRLASGGMQRMSESMMDPSNTEAFASALDVTQEEFRQMREEDPSGTLLDVADAANESEEASNLLKDELGKTGSEFATLGQNTDSAREGMDMANEAWEENTSIQEEAETAASTFNSRLEIARNQLQNVAITIGGQLLGPLTALLGHVSGAVERFSALNEKTDGMLGAITLAGGVVGGFGVALAALVGGPITLAIGAVGLLATAWVTGWEDIKTAVDEGVARVTELLGSVMDWLGENGPAIAERALGIFETMLTDIAVWIKENGPGLIGEAFELVGKAIRLVAIDLYNAITGNEDSIIKTMLTDAASWLIENGPGILVGALEFLIDSIVAAFEGLYEGLIGGSLIPELIEDIGSYILGAGTDLVEAAVDSLIGTVEDQFEMFKDAIIGAGGLIKNLFGAVADYISGDAAEGLASAAKEAGKAAANALKDKFNAVMPGSFSIPPITIGGGTFKTGAASAAPGIKSSYDIPSKTIGDVDLDIPQLQEGGMIEEEGLAFLHAGEAVVPAADVSQGGDGGDTYVDGIEVTIEGDADRDTVKRGVSDALRSINATR